MLCRWVRQSVRNAYPIATIRPRSAAAQLQEQGRQEEQEDRAELVRDAVEPVRVQRHRHQRGEEVPGPDRHRPLDRVEHLVEARPAEDVAEERIDGVARVDIGPQIPPQPAQDDRGARREDPRRSPSQSGSRARRSPERRRRDRPPRRNPASHQRRVFHADGQPGEHPDQDRPAWPAKAGRRYRRRSARRARRCRSGEGDVVERRTHPVGDRRHQQRDRAGPPGRDLPGSAGPAPSR